MTGARKPTTANVLTWAREVPADEAEPALLEAHVARDHDEAALFHGLGGKVTHRQIEDRVVSPAPSSAWGKAVDIAKTVAQVLVLAAPIAGFAPFMMGGDIYTGYGDQHFASQPWPLERVILVSSVCFWVAVLFPLLTLFDWIRKGRRREAFAMGSQSIVIVPAVLSLSALNGQDVDVTAVFSAPVLPIWTALTCSIVALAVIATISRRRTPEDDRYRIVIDQWPHETKVAEAVQAMSQERRDRLLRERNAALAVLHERGLLDADAYEYASGTDLGRLNWPAASQRSP